MLEIEKSFLVKSIPSDLSQFKCESIKQGYISPSPQPLRIRKKGEKLELTKKIKVKENDHSTAEEITIMLTEYEFDKLWPLVERKLEKDRYLIPLANNLTAELDVYRNDLKGLAFVEVEFTSQEQMEAFVAPEWFGQDVTQDEFSSNAFLAGKKFAEIEKYLTDTNSTT